MFCYSPSPISRRQLHYHSQRRDSKESVVRPSSNYYEYESVMRSLPYTSGADNASRLVDNNSNSLTRQGELLFSSINSWPTVFIFVSYALTNVLQVVVVGALPKRGPLRSIKIALLVVANNNRHLVISIQPWEQSFLTIYRIIIMTSEVIKMTI